MSADEFLKVQRDIEDAAVPRRSHPKGWEPGVDTAKGTLVVEGGETPPTDWSVIIRELGLDESRVAIMGTSYGGYAALMGAVRRPDLYKAAISICGLGDLADSLAYDRRDDESADGFVYNYWVSRIGDLRTDAAAIAAASPRLRAAEIDCPVLLVHGVNDRIVQVHQSRQMHEALRAAGKRSDYVEVSGAGHADWEDDVEQSLMERYVALFSRAFA